MIQGFWKKYWYVAAVGLAIAVLVVAFIAGRQNGDGSEDQRKVSQAFLDLAGFDTVHVRTSYEMNLPERLRDQRRPLTKITAVVEGDVVRDEDGALELAGDLLVEARGPGNAFFTNGVIQVLKNKVLFRLNEFPILLNPSGSLIERWTNVDAALLGADNGSQVVEAFSVLGQAVNYVETRELDGQQLDYYTGALSGDQEDVLGRATALAASGSPALDVVSRLLAANNVKQLEIWLDQDTGRLARVAANFVRPLSGDREFDFAKLTMIFSDYGKAVVFDEVEAQLTVQPAVFGRIFGTGSVEKIEVEN